MAFTGKKIKGSKVLTPETVENRAYFYKLINEIKKEDTAKEQTIKEQMFWAMFEHLSHSSQKEFVEWARIENWKVIVKVANQ